LGLTLGPFAQRCNAFNGTWWIVGGDMHLDLQHGRRRQRVDPALVRELRDRCRGDVVDGRAVPLGDVRPAISIGHTWPTMYIGAVVSV
jgi:hypothetical protein